MGPMGQNGILKTDTKDCYWQFQSAFTRAANSNPPSKGASPFSSMVEITVDSKGVAKLLGGLNLQLTAKVPKEYSTQI